VAGVRVYLPGAGHWHLPFTALCALSAAVFTWLTDDTTAATVVRDGWPIADLTVVSRLDTEFCSAVVCDGYADFTSLTNVFASA